MKPGPKPIITAFPAFELWQGSPSKLAKLLGVSRQRVFQLFRAAHRMQNDRKHDRIGLHQCENCGAPAEAHHPDYSNLDLVVWLCHPCHVKVHGFNAQHLRDWQAAQPKKPLDNIHYCLRCAKPFTCPVGSRRRYCEPCEAILEQEGGGRTPTKWTKGHGPRAKPKPVVIDAIVVSRRKRPDMVVEDA